MLKNILAGGAVAASLVFVASPAAATVPLLQNGNFESDTGGSFVDWSATGSVTWKAISDPSPADTSKVAGITCNASNCLSTTSGKDELSQTVAAVAGQEYQLTFQFAPGAAYTSANTANGFNVVWNGNSVDEVTDIASTNLVTYSVDFTAKSTGPTVLSFLGEQHGSTNSSYLDNVVLTAVPEPATWAMMLLGFGMIGFAARARRKVSVTYA